MRWIVKTALRVFTLGCALVVFGCPAREESFTKYGPPPALEEPVVDVEGAGQEPVAEPVPPDSAELGE